MTHNDHQVRDYIVLTPYPVEPGHTLMTISRISAQDWKPELGANASFKATGDNAGIIINKRASIMDYNRIQAGQKERQQPPSAKMSFKVFLINSETNKLTLEHRTLRFWLDHSAVIKATTTKDKNNGIQKNHEEKQREEEEEEEDENNFPIRSMHIFANLKQESSQLAQAYFCQLLGTKPEDFPKDYGGFMMKLMRQLKADQFNKIIKMEVELRQLTQDEKDLQNAKPPSPGVTGIDNDASSASSESGRGSPLTSQKVLDIIESSYPNPTSIKEICSTTQTDITIVKQLVDELAQREKINTNDDGQHYTRTLKSTTDTKIQMVKQMPKVQRAQQPVIAIITAQYCEKLAVDSMISDKETFVRYRVTAGQDESTAATSSNYVYTLGNIGDHRVVSTKLTSIGHSRDALIAAGNATTRLLGTFPEIEYVFLVGCGGGVPNYSDFSSHVRLGDIVVSHLPSASNLDASTIITDLADCVSGDSQQGSGGSGFVSASHHSNNRALSGNGNTNKTLLTDDHVYVHCRPKLQEQQVVRTSSGQAKNEPGLGGGGGGGIPMSYSVHKNLKRHASGTNGLVVSDLDDCEEKETPTKVGVADDVNSSATLNDSNANKLTYEECHFRLWRPVKLDLQELAQRLWLQGLDNAKHRIWDYYIDEGIKALQEQEIEAARPKADTDKLYMSIGPNSTIEVNHPEPGEEELDLRREGRPMCHFGPIGSGKPALGRDNEQLKQQMISQFNLRAFDSEFDPVVESIYGNCKESYIMIRGISDYKDGRKKKDWQQYSALVAAAFMKSIIVNLKPLS